MKNSRTKASGVWRMTVLGTAVLLALAGTAAAGQAATQQKVVPVQGVQAHVDPATGALRQPSPAEVKALVDAARTLFAARMAQSTKVATHSDGSISAKLGADALNVWVATVAADGSIRQQCVESAGAAAAAQSAPALEVK